LSIALVGKNKGHPAVFPVDLPLFFIKLLCPQDGLVMDPFGGSGTTGIAALSLGRSCVLIDNNLTYCEEALRRLKDEAAAHHDEVRFVDHENQNGSTHVQNKLLDQRQNYESSDE
jgi:DNA modification methylase